MTIKNELGASSSISAIKYNFDVSGQQPAKDDDFFGIVAEDIEAFAAEVAQLAAEGRVENPSANLVNFIGRMQEIEANGNHFDNTIINFDVDISDRAKAIAETPEFAEEFVITSPDEDGPDRINDTAEVDQRFIAASHKLLGAIKAVNPRFNGDLTLLDKDEEGNLVCRPCAKYDIELAHHLL